MPTSSGPTIQHEFLGFIDSLTESDRTRLAREATQRARDLGLVVLREHGDVDIPLTLTPEILEAPVAVARGRDAHRLLSAVVKTARWTLRDGSEAPEARSLYARFTPLERRCLARASEAEDVTIARVDWFLDTGGRHHALELNATIPAMQGYSDAAATAWITSVGRLAGLDDARVAGLVARNGSNADALRRSIVAHAAAARPPFPSIAIIHREHDSQVRELEALARRFRDAGHEVRLATPRDVTVTAEGVVLVGGSAWDILYRHIFARRMPDPSPLADVAAGNALQRLQNRVNGQFEVKGVFAELSRWVDEAGGGPLGLDAAEVETVRRTVPWTRVLSASGATLYDGSRVSDLAAWAKEHPDELVVKRSWDYGGKSVHLGWEVVAAEGIHAWHSRVDEALREGAAEFVVQRRVVAPRQVHWTVGAAGSTQREEVFVDASSYTASGDRDVPSGGVVRFARVGIVNIVGGGGVAPLIDAAVARALANALRARPPARTA